MWARFHKAVTSLNLTTPNGMMPMTGMAKSPTSEDARKSVTSCATIALTPWFRPLVMTQRSFVSASPFMSTRSRFSGGTIAFCSPETEMTRRGGCARVSTNQRKAHTSDRSEERVEGHATSDSCRKNSNAKESHKSSGRECASARTKAHGSHDQHHHTPECPCCGPLSSPPSQ